MFALRKRTYRKEIKLKFVRIECSYSLDSLACMAKERLHTFADAYYIPAWSLLETAAMQNARPELPKCRALVSPAQRQISK